MVAVARRWVPWGAILVVLVVALAVGVQRNTHQTIEQRVHQLAGQYRCPSCDGESAADSNTATSIEIRDLIQADLRHGQSASQIRAAMISDYGADILESPPTKGISLLVWVVPVVAVAAGVVGLGLAFRRWKRRLVTLGAPSAADRALVDEALHRPDDGTAP
jgi:cytochrome c-type biogenesis protein CcmH